MTKIGKNHNKEFEIINNGIKPIVSLNSNSSILFGINLFGSIPKYSRRNKSLKHKYFFPLFYCLLKNFISLILFQQ